MNSKINSILSMVGILLIFESCQYDPYAYKFTTIHPNKSNIIGKYRFNYQTLNDKINDSVFSRSEIILNGNMTYRVINIPDFHEDNTFNSVSKQGKWDVEIVGGVDDGSGKAKDIWGIRLDSLPEEIEFVKLMQNNPPYKLLIGFGDPDQARVIIFLKE